jgi:LCP family protein required for cell wall assembly
MARDPWREYRPTLTENSNLTSRGGQNRPPKHRAGCGCGSFLGGFLLAFLALAVAYFLAPVRTNILLLGIDYAPPGSAVGRSDTIILMTVIPLEPYVGLLSIPRDLWVIVPGVGENRINTAHFFAEAAQAGSGPYAAMETVRQNFGIGVDYYVRVRFEGFREIVDALGGVDIVLEKPMAGYPAGLHHLTGNKALAFARHRLGSDDFFRMEQGQLLVKAILREMLRPRGWPKWPGVFLALQRNIDTNVPLWQWPRLGLALLRAGPDGLDSRIIGREMVTPFITSQGANVLLPDWDKINPLLIDMFGK